MKTLAENKAKELIDDLGIDTLPIQLDDFCSEISSPECQVQYHVKSFRTEKFQGMCLSSAPTQIDIFVNNNEKFATRKRFTGAHEIGHAVLHVMEGSHSKFECTSTDIAGKNNKTNNLEAEANSFASELLMPEALISPLIKKFDLSWEMIGETANKCDTSLQATARRLVSLSPETCALIIHQNQNIPSWVPVKSSRFNLFIPQAPFPYDADYSEIAGIGEPLPSHFDSCNTVDWIPEVGDKLPEEIYYSSIYLSELGFTYTLLFVEE